jgi:hypothetical protein
MTVRPAGAMPKSHRLPIPCGHTSAAQMLNLLMPKAVRLAGKAAGWKRGGRSGPRSRKGSNVGRRTAKTCHETGGRGSQRDGEIAEHSEAPGSADELCPNQAPDVPHDALHRSDRGKRLPVS